MAGLLGLFLRTYRGEDEPLLFRSLGAGPPATPLHYLDVQNNNNNHCKRKKFRGRKKNGIISQQQPYCEYTEALSSLFV
jgi:hypothetical protein